MGILIGGKPAVAKKATTHIGKHRQLTMDQIKKRHPADPFPAIATFRADSVEHRISVGAELKMWAEQRIEEMTPIADEWDWLRLQLREPALQDHPDRPAAMKRLQGMADQLAELASDVAYLEAHADRIWQSMDPADRDDLAARWVAETTDDRLILHSWLYIAKVGFKWPDYFRVDMGWFDCLADPLKQDIKDRWPKHGICLGKEHELDTPNDAPVRNHNIAKRRKRGVKA